MANHLSVNVGDRIKLRQRAWRIRGRRSLPPHIVIFELESLDTEKPRSISVVVPPDEFFVLPTESLYFDVKGLNAFASWANDHRLIAATLMRETAVLSGARFGRVCLEAYQLAPTLRLLNKPRPSLLIADDVGLGKTIEAGLALLELAARGRARRVLVVTPPGLLLQWKDELEEKFGMQFTLIENAAGLARVQTQLPAGISPWEALPRVLTSIDFLKKETVRDRALRKQWDLIIVDEVHGLAEAGTPANPYRTQRTRLGLALRDSAKGLILLSATPHNGYPHSFRSLINLVEPTAATFHGKPETIARRVQRAMIRRMKPQIVHKLPNGTEEPVFPRRDVQGIPVEVKGAERELLKKVAAYCSRTARSAKEAENAEQVTFAMQIIKKRSLSSRNALGKTIENRLNALRKKDEEEVPPTNAEIRDLQADLPLDEATAERTAIRIIKSALPKEEKQRKAEIRALNDIRKTLRSLPERDPTTFFCEKYARCLGGIRMIRSSCLLNTWIRWRPSGKLSKNHRISRGDLLSSVGV
ncbi:DEAD/DEAH box helicase [Candidatus Desulforudis audaxviator]|uniref:DEAD/DEAH box helicase n=1 Tax=Candidatus Desulforudis audaxviator TaxID=471827 RepID=UPI0002D608E2|nr:DEAD/DEAH box helicase [Candidatus Desulforudis audaxviator]